MFNKFPVNPVRDLQRDIRVASGYDAVLSALRERLNPFGDRPVLVLDGTHGAAFDKWLERMLEAFGGQSARVEAVSAAEFLKSPAEIRELFKDNITDNRAFGYMTEAHISAYFAEDAQKRCKERLAALRRRTGEAGMGDRSDERFAAQIQRLIVLYGTGAHWLADGCGDVHVFLDLSRETQQIMHKQGLLNFALDWNEDALEKYKIAFFVEWPILEGYRKANLTGYDYYADANRPEHPVMVAVSDLVDAARDIAKRPIRVKPFFAPGIWGGQYLKRLADLPEDWDNCAWSFEPIAPENSVLIGIGAAIIEVPFLVIMNYAYKDIMGERPVRLFGDFFPIRFDYLDTIEGGNLSTQVHGKQAYIREHFNYVLEQQESYYIMEKREGSKVYLGLTERCTGDAFVGAVKRAQETGEPIEFTDYVQEWDCRKGDLFLIPTGTVHCSGKDNLVLEISSTTWWFTFKIYDYVRKDKDGKPRPINIEHAEPNIDWYKKTAWVREHLIPVPQKLREQGANEEYVLGKRQDLLFYVNRIHLTDRWRDHTNEELLLLNLVEGEKIRIRSVKRPDVFVEFGYAESYILPAVFGAFEIENLGTGPCKIIKAGVSPEWEVKLTDE
ncbi:mannose-6-phosphate isomerase [Paenibacillus cisolokensis]|uniref:Mannose-6-phosphate isomerase n=1 Tax=Paenibacillus cisolokensis TaxID=1658519 RepID=A0ABQ4N0Z0_9BACL|nr:class I mannose-6-phosphate isomerase [Paenibacillus cisolokensis]GIQ61855.1 mannose-6-phosphate isomerase [Paenibacillus cisolokensis]